MAQKILLINPFGIGDVLFTTPVIKAIKENNPKNFLGYWCNERVKPILENNHYIDKIFALSRGDLKKIFKKSKFKGIKSFLKLFFEIKKEGFDVAVDLSLDHRYGLFSKLVGIKKRIGFDYKNRGRFLTEKIKIDGYKDKHVVEYYLDILKYLDIPRPNNPNLNLFVLPDDKIWADNFLRQHNINDNVLLIGIAPCGGASWGKNAYLKHWPKEKFVELCKKILDNYSAKILLFADIEEKETVDYIQKMLDNRAINLAGRLSLLEYLALLSKVNILITNDSGNIHTANALGIKTISIFGPVDEKVYGPYPESKNHIVIKKDLPCRPCYKNFKVPECKYDLNCLKGISVEEVYLAVESLLKG